MTRLEELMSKLPPELHKEVEEFLEFLLKKQEKKRTGAFKLDWRGELRDFRNRYTSVEIQHKAQEWWGD